MGFVKFQESPSNTITDILIQDGVIYVSSWDCFIYAYDFHTQAFLYKIENDFPILKMCWKDFLIYSDGGGFVNFNDTIKSSYKINFNIKGISVIEPCNNSLIIGGFNEKLIIHYKDGRSERLNIKGKVYGSSIFDNNLILNFGNTIRIFDIRNFNQISEIKNKKQVRSFCMKLDKIFIGDVDGKLKIHDFVKNEDVVFNAHVEIRDNVKRTYPVNCIIFDEYLYTCGSDGIVNRWKDEGRLKSRNIFRNNLGILKMASYNGKIVVGSGYNFEMGGADTSENSIFMI